MSYTITRILRTAAVTTATGAALALTAVPAQASRPYPGTEPYSASVGSTTEATSAVTTPSGLQPQQVAAGAGLGLLVGAGAVVAARRRRPTGRAVAV